MAVVDVYSRRGCHLCEVLTEQLLELVGDRAEVRVHDIDADATLRERYDIRVPVVAINGSEICEASLDAESVLRALAPRR